MSVNIIPSQNLHPITIMTLPDKNNKKIACKVLLDQCCIDKGLILLDLANMLDVPTSQGSPQTFLMAAGSFTADPVLKVENAMLPCLLTNRTFTIKLMVVPTKVESNHSIILGQDLISILKTTQFCGSKKKLPWSLETIG